MIEGLTTEQLPSAIEAMLFVTNEALPASTIADMLDVPKAEVTKALKHLESNYQAENRGILLREVAGGWRLCTNPKFHKLIEQYVASWDTRKISQAALEVLAIVAYSQPVTRAGIAGVRGVNSDSALGSLMEKGLVREIGTANAPGNPVLYGTSHAFLEKFGLKNIKDLPDLNYFAPDEETQNLIRERLGATRVEIGQSADGQTEGQQSFDDLAFNFENERPEDIDIQTPADFSMAAAQDMLKEALASSLGVTEKIDFDSLVFESDDE